MLLLGRSKEASDRKTRKNINKTASTVEESINMILQQKEDGPKENTMGIYAHANFKYNHTSPAHSLESPTTST